MIILSIHFATHDLTAVVADDYRILSAVQGERLTRVKGDGREAYLSQTIGEALRVAGKNRGDVEVFATSRARFDAKYLIWPLHYEINYALRDMLGKGAKRWLSLRYADIGSTDHHRAFKARAYMDSLGLCASKHFFDHNHHVAHALSALFFTGWQDSLLYTADGGGDFLSYSAHHLQDGILHALYGGTSDHSHSVIRGIWPNDSIGTAYSYMTEALGYKRDRHEGKLTGLAAFGKPTLYDQLARHFSVADDGRIHSDFGPIGKDYAGINKMRAAIFAIANNAKPMDCAASIQKLLEDLICKSVSIYLERTGARNIGLAGGVFANVSLNRCIAELPGVQEVFIFPGMGDEGIAVGGLYEFLLKRDGLRTWLAQRRRLNNVYWGGAYDGEVATVFNAPDIKRLPGAVAEVNNVTEVAKITARLLKDGAIIALFCKQMEFGPRALGARSILANPADKTVNDTLNKRLSRTEFMPFAPVVLEEDAADVFEVTDVNRYAMRFMTITCIVRDAWRDKIPAVVHIDGTARPQIIRDADNPLYANILRAFKAASGLPVLINTSFNAHEEPIIHTPQEALRALRDRRVDYVATAVGVYGLAEHHEGGSDNL